MKKLAIVLIAIGSLLSGCVGFVVPVDDGRVANRDRDRDRNRDGYSNRVDRDGDGVRNSQDRRPDDPRRY